MALDDLTSQIELELAKRRSAKQVDMPWWSSPLSTAIANIPIQRQKVRMYKKNDLNEQMSALKPLSKLIRDKTGVDNFVKLATNTSNEMREFGLATKADVVDQFAANISSDYETYSTEMERGASIIDDPSFLDTQEEFLDLKRMLKENPRMQIKNDAGELFPKYENTAQYLTEQNRMVNSIVSRIGTVSKGTQFRYNKNAKYTDFEIQEKLMSHQKRLGVAVQTALGDGVITPDEAELIMLGDVETYKTKRKENISLRTRQYNSIDKAYQSIFKQLTGLEKDGMGGLGLGAFTNILEGNVQGEAGDAGEEFGIDTSLRATDEDDLKVQLKKMLGEFVKAKEVVKDSYEMWSGQPMWPSAKPQKGEVDEFGKFVLVPDKPTSELTITDVVTPKDQVKEKGKVEIQKTDFDEKRFSNQPDTFPELKKAKGKFVFSQNGDFKEWDNTAYIKDFDERVPVLNAGYDKYYWYNGKWRHMKGDPPAGERPVMTEKEARLVKGERGKALEIVKEDVRKFFDFPKTSVTKVIGEVKPSTYGIKRENESIRKLWDSSKQNFPRTSYEDFADAIILSWGELDKKTKSQHGSFKNYINKIMESK